MNKKTNLILAAILFGGIITILPMLLKLIIYTAIVFYLFVTFDFWEYEKRYNGGIEHD